MQIPLSHTRLRQLFRISIAVKAMDGVLEVISGLVLLVLSPAQMALLAQLLTRRELLEDPGDMLANFFLTTATNVTPHGKWVTVIFLLGHGCVKLVFVWELLRRKVWVYPFVIIVLLCLILYQIIILLHSHSLLLAGLTVLDTVIVLLAWHEYSWRKQPALRE